ncbi:hypothetical protein AB1Y20_011578 [Prymnesium parvum]|uniref:Uncharacterized protein n=1 Tax=Prymnesium parvum TaxID=97485 RepID=A0AB34IIM6_PRYPA
MEPSQKPALARTVSGKFRKRGTHWSDWLPSPPGWFIRWNQSNLYAASAPGFFDREGPPVKKLLSYSPRGMWTFFALFADIELSAFHGHMTFHLVWALLVPLVFCFICASIDGYEPIVDGVPSAARKWVILFENKMRTSSNEFRGLVAYVLGGYVARAFMMWHARRKNYASFCGTTRNLILQLSAAVPMDAAGGMSAEEVARLRSDLGRWAVLTHEVAMLKARGEMDSEEGRQYLLKAGLMEEGEWEAMVAGDRHTTVLCSARAPRP